MLLPFRSRRTNPETMRSSTPVILLMLAGGMAACSTNEAVAPSHDEAVPVFARQISYTPWTTAISAEQIPGTSTEFNSASGDGCPFISPDGRKFFQASNRVGTMGGIDIWVSTREEVSDPWGPPVNVGAPVNSTANDFCPTMSRNGHTFYFVSNRVGSGTCGGDDIYVAELGDDGTFGTPTNLGCAVNSAGNEAGPFPLTEPGSGPVLYFSSTRAGGFSPEAIGAITGDADIYRSEWKAGSYAAATLVPGVNTASTDLQPNLQRDGIEMYFASNRPGIPGTTGTLGGNDIFVATRASAHEAWGTPMDLGANVNSSIGDETRPSLSWDAKTLYFGSTRPFGEGANDIYVTTRELSNNH